MLFQPERRRLVGHICRPDGQAELGEAGIAGHREQGEEVAAARLSAKIVQHLTGRIGQHKARDNGKSRLAAAGLWS